MSPGIFRTPMGIYVLEQDTGSSRQIEIAGRLDDSAQSEVALICQYVPAGGVVINAGAFLGEHTEIYSKLVGGRGHVFAFEPHPVTYTALEANIARLNNVTISPFALGDGAVAATLYETENRGASCILPPSTAYTPANAGHAIVTFSVSMVGLDEYLLPQLQRCDFIHLDAEGTEMHILKGAQKLLTRFKPPILLEVCVNHLARVGFTPTHVFQYLRSLGYRAHRLLDLSPTNQIYNILALSSEE